MRRNEQLFSRSEMLSEEYDQVNAACAWFEKVFSSSEKGRKEGGVIAQKYWICLEELYLQHATTYETVKNFKEDPAFQEAVYACIDDFMKLSKCLENEKIILERSRIIEV